MRTKDEIIKRIEDRKEDKDHHKEYIKKQIDSLINTANELKDYLDRGRNIDECYLMSSTRNVIEQLTRLKIKEKEIETLELIIE